MAAVLPSGDFQSYLPDPGGADEEEIRRLREAQLAQEQAQALAQHQAYAQQLEAASQQVELKQGDLDLTNRLLQATDPTVDKSARKWLLGQISQRVGIDPKGETSKQVQQMLLGLQPETSEQLRRVLVEQVKGAAPGQVNQIIKGVLTGQVGGEALIQGLRVGAAQTGEYQAAEAPGNAGSRVARPLPGAAGAAGAANAAVTGSLPDPGDRMGLGAADIAGGGGDAMLLGAEGDTLGDLSIGAQGKTTEQPRERTASEGLQRALGLPTGEASGFPYAQRGITAFTKPTPEQDKLGDQIITEQQAIRRALRGTLDIEDVLTRSPNAASMGGSIARAWGSTAATFSGVLESVFGIKSEDHSKEMENYASGKSDGSKLSGMERLAADAARVAVLQNQVFRDVIAGSGGIQTKEGLGRLTEKDAAVIREGIFSGDPGQLKIGLRSILEKTINDHQDRVRSTTGYTDYSTNLEGATSDEMQRFIRATRSGSSVLPNNFTKDILPKTMDRIKTAHEEDRAAASGAPSDAGAGAGPSRGRGELDPNDPYSPAKKRAAKSELEARMKAIEDENRYYRAQAEGRAQRSEARADRAEERQRRKDIQEIFSNLGHAIARSFGGSIHFPAVNLGGDQDASAFVYRPTQRRQPPRIPGGRRSRSED